MKEPSETDRLLPKRGGGYSTITQVSKQDQPSEKQELDQFFATAVCGCNITSSCLYVIAFSTISGGKYTPFIMFAISELLFLFRSIYTEVVTALPVNGGTYNLLKTTIGPKSGAVVGCLTMLSYVTTAVISSHSASLYFKRTMDILLEEELSHFTIRLIPFVILTLAAILNIVGISQSAFVALLIFSFHLVTMLTLIICCGITSIGIFGEGIPQSPYADEYYPQSMLSYNWYDTELSDGVLLGIFFGFSAGLLGISGFESSANFVESQKPGVFPKTLRNMWFVVSILNVSLSFLSLCLMTVDDVASEATSGALLSMMAHHSIGGKPLRIIVGLDAGIILSGAVLSAFVGFTGLSHRMAIDGCLPPIFTQRNSSRGTLHWIIIFYWTLTCAMSWFCRGDLGIMSGIYTIAFLSVMGAFALGNVRLKTHELRFALPQCKYPASWTTVFIGFAGVMLGLIGNVLSRGIDTIIGTVIFTAGFVGLTTISLKYHNSLRSEF